MSLAVLLADDHKIMREGLRALLEKEPDIQVSGEAGNGRQAVELAQEVSPDVVVMDVSMPDLNGIEATRRIVASQPQTRVVALSVHSDKRFVTQMFEAGASAYLLKECAFEELVSAIKEVVAGRLYVSPGIGGAIVQDYVRQMALSETAVHSALTPREREVVQLLAEGKATKEIAALLNVSVKTVDTHRQHVMEKLGVHSIAELTKLAVREGLTALEP